jgi:hypothetical protein
MSDLNPFLVGGLLEVILEGPAHMHLPVELSTVPRHICSQEQGRVKAECGRAIRELFPLIN